MTEAEYCDVCQLRFKEGQRICYGIPTGYGQYKQGTPGLIHPGKMHVFHLSPEGALTFSNIIQPYIK